MQVTTMAEQTDVLIVGAGPAGMAAAIGLAQLGRRFILLDAATAGQTTSRAAVVHAATLAALRKLGVAETLIAQGLKVPHFRVRDRDAVLLHASFSELSAPDRFALMIPQDETEAILLSRLEALGAAVRRPWRVEAVETGADSVRATCKVDGETKVIEASRIVAADGEKSIVRTAAGISFPGHSYGSFMLADVRMTWPISREEVSLFFSGDGTLVVAPMSRDRYRVVAQYPNAPSSPSLDLVRQVLETRGPRTGVAVSEVLWGSRFQVHHRLADRLSDGRTVLVGDAAHVHSPAGGQGMNLGLRDAIALSEALAHDEGPARSAALTAYAATRRAAAAKVLAMTDQLTRVATLGSPTQRSIRNLAIRWAGRLPAVRRRAARTLAGLS